MANYYETTMIYLELMIIYGPFSFIRNLVNRNSALTAIPDIPYVPERTKLNLRTFSHYK